MKQPKQQKWILSALLVAALGSQYYFSTTSKNIEALDLASRAPSEAASPAEVALRDASAILARAVSADTARRASGDTSDVIAVGGGAASGDASRASSDTTSGDTTRRVERPASGDASLRTEASGPDCADCVTLTRAEADRIRALLAQISAQRSADTSRSAVDPNETPAERARRLRQEARDQREEARLAKAEQERDAQELRDEEFKDKAEEIADRCNDDMDCLTSRFTSLLSRYTGKKKVSISVVRTAYRTYIEKHIKDALSDDSRSEDVASALEALGSDIPSEYRQIKENLLDAVKQAATARAEAINQNFRTADQLSKQNKPAESNQYFQLAMSDKSAFTSSYQLYAQSIANGLSEDSTTLAYMRRNFSPAVANLFTNLSNTNGLGLTTTSTTNTDGTTVTSGRSIVRGGSTTTVAGPTVQSTGSGDALSGVTFGAPTPAGTSTGARGATRGSY